MELYDIMRTTFAVREFTDDPLPDPVLFRILDNARFAPTGANRQGTHVVAVRDAALRTTRRAERPGRTTILRSGSGRKVPGTRSRLATCMLRPSRTRQYPTNSSRRSGERRSYW